MNNEEISSDNVQCTREDDRERCELDIQGRGCNEEVYPWTMTERLQPSWNKGNLQLWSIRGKKVIKKKAVFPGHFKMIEKIRTERGKGFLSLFCLGTKLILLTRVL
uniref:Uncharacterized protein n=1 Tax=Oryza barthii TaxID=65489 RepID=A0A0D3G5B1_9ORYZ